VFNYRYVYVFNEEYIDTTVYTAAWTHSCLVQSIRMHYSILLGHTYTYLLINKQKHSTQKILRICSQINRYNNITQNFIDSEIWAMIG